MNNNKSPVVPSGFFFFNMSYHGTIKMFVAKKRERETYKEGNYLGNSYKENQS